jgi:lipopolysaccharide/colanic/teichoic acid biosynthesis glycosyltransferase/glycosyltransferase involved in cell wall biosynthesis
VVCSAPEAPDGYSVNPSEPRIAVSVIVPAYNAAAVLPRCLSALARQNFPCDRYEVILVDDGSRDETATVARAAGVRVISQPNAGPAAARNAGAAAATGELLLFTDADCAPEPGWISALAAPFDLQRMVGATLGSATIAGAKGAYLTDQRGAVPRFTQLEYEDRYDRMVGAESIDFIDTYSAAYRRDVFLANRGFDAIFPTASVEDQELSFRLAEKGYRLVFVPEARVYHLHNPTLAAYIRRKFLIGYWKALLARWHPSRLVRDSHTPQALKVQMGLAALFAVAFLTAALTFLWSKPLTWAALTLTALSVLAFQVTSLPFLAKVWRRDRGVLLPAVGLLWVRAYALGAGFALGLVRFRGQAGDRRPPLTASQRLAKRTIDLLIGGVTFVVMALPMAMIALAIKLDSPGPVIFRQTRIGQDGRPFRILKFRTMVADAEAMLPQLVDLDRLAEPAFKLRHDPRVTRVGSFLRRWSLDELPQLVNVLRGEMSLVGPRPEEAALVSRYTDDQRRRLAVKPGMTGPMQVNGRGDLPFEQRLSLELEYIEHYSLRKDIALLLRTIPSVWSGKGAY